MGRFLIYFNAIMVLFYLALGIFFILSPYIKESLPEWERYTLASVFLVYGLFRAYAAYKKYKDNDY